MVKNLPANVRDMGSIPEVRKIPWRRNGNHSSILAWEITRTEEPGRVQSIGLQKNQMLLSD